MTSARLSLRHTTRYRFDAPVTYGLQQVRVTPKSNTGQTVLNWDVQVEGGRREASFEDHHRNTVDLLSIDRDAQSFSVVCSGEVEVAETHGITGQHLGPSPLWLYRHATPRTKIGSGVRGLLRQAEGNTPLERLHSLMHVIGGAVTYDTRSTDPGRSAEEAIVEATGVCQDHTHIFLAAAREMSCPARYVSGYLLLDDRTDQEAMHAWAEVHVEGLGWVGFDVSNGISPDTRYVRVATGLDYADAAPVTGLRLGSAGESLSVEIEVAQQ